VTDCSREEGGDDDTVGDGDETVAFLAFRFATAAASFA
jgi:hypothetical protein